MKVETELLSAWLVAREECARRRAYLSEAEEKVGVIATEIRTCFQKAML